MRKLRKIRLIAYREGTDPDTKDVVQAEDAREIVGVLLSVSGTEFYQAAAAGLKPEEIVEIWEHEYRGETDLRIKYGDVWEPYHVLRHYASPKAGRLQLTCYRGIRKESP